MQFSELFVVEKVNELFPQERTDAFFDALFGGAEEGAYDIAIEYVTGDDNGLEFAFVLTQRPGKCLACNLTYGLPQVFSRHPVINLRGFVDEVGKLIGKESEELSVELGVTKEISREVHRIPIHITFV